MKKRCSEEARPAGRREERCFVLYDSRRIEEQGLAAYSFKPVERGWSKKGAEPWPRSAKSLMLGHIVVLVQKSSRNYA